jgi:hypothetical protein
MDFYCLCDYSCNPALIPRGWRAAEGEGRKIVSRFNSEKIPVGLQRALEKHEK